MRASIRLRVTALLSTLVAVAAISAPDPTDEPEEEPWRAARALGAPDWLEVRLQHLARYEYLFNQFRAGLAGDDQLIDLRTTLFSEISSSPFRAGLELIDARIYLPDSNTPVNDGFVDALDFLQIYGALDFEDLFETGDEASVLAGRYTMDLGSRRLVARNRYRNTINGFTGVDLRYLQEDRFDLRAFATLPITRRPLEREAQVRNELVLDTEGFDTVFWGLYVAFLDVFQEVSIDGYVFGLHDQPPAGPTCQLVTPGARLLRSAAPGALDFEVEATIQVGVSEPANVTLTQLAFFAHASAGFTFDVASSPRIALAYDYASGDWDPEDDLNNRFNPLFGTPRPELGPTMLYGAFAFSNIATPGVRLDLEPLPDVDAFVAYRAFWLASSRDAWTTAGLRDPTGRSGSFLGQQIEVRAVWDVFSSNLLFETGFAHLFRGGFAVVAPGAGAAKDPTIVYVELVAEL